jgi:hypothetical protein
MTAPVQAPAKPGDKKQQQVLRRPFVVGTRRVDKQTFDQTKTMTANTQTLPVYECDPNGFLGGAYILVECTTSANAATVAFQLDGPLSAIDTITFSDTNNKPVLGPMGGHDLYEIVKYGGYAFQDDCRTNATVYTAVTGSGGTGGSFSFILRLPVEIVNRDGLGALPNKSSSATFDIAITLAGSAAVYSTAPTTLGSVRVRIQQFGWMDPNAADMRGNPVAQNPPGVQTTQFWQKQTYTINAGAFAQRLQGIDSMLRALLFELRDSTTSRQQGDADWPDPFTMVYETSQPIQRVRAIWRHMIGEDFDYRGATPDAAGARDYGVYPEYWNRDWSKPGYETRFKYLPVSAATTISVSGTIQGSGSHTLVVFVNKIVPANGNPLVLTGR